MARMALQWSLEHTSKDVIGISRGYLAAATSDNVQPLALIASEGLGTIVAMAPDSCHKVFQLCDRTHKSATLNFLKIQVGYRKGDSGYQLARSDAGLRFLGLAACLSTINAWDAAVIFQKLIQETAKDKTLVPTSQHLKQLMLALQDRLSRSGFCDNILGWAQIFNGEPDTLGDLTRVRNDDDRLGTSPPPSGTIIGLTKALSELARIGNDNLRIKIITNVDYAAWLVAFIKWCLGSPPRIIFHEGLSLGSETSSQITVEIFRTSKKDFEVRVETYEQTNKLTNLVKDVGSMGETRGMVKLRTYGQAMLHRRFGMQMDLRYRAASQAIPYACALVRRSLIINKRWNKILTTSQNTLGKSCTVKEAQLLPPVEQICQTIHEYMGLSAEVSPPSLPLPNELIVEDLSLVSLVKSTLANTCTCDTCLNQSTDRSLACLFTGFMLKVSQCVAEIMSLSLLNALDPEGVRVYYGFDTFPKTDFFSSWVAGTLNAKEIKSLLIGDNATITVSHVLEHTTRLLGHIVNHESVGSREWVMSSYCDQTLYPRLLSTQTAQQEGILCLECIPGTITWGNEQFKSVESLCSPWHDFSDSETDDMSKVATPMASQRLLEGSNEMERSGTIFPSNNFFGHELKWEIIPRDVVLEVGVSIPTFLTSPTRNPLHFLGAVANSLFVNCAHDRLASFTPHHGKVLEVSPLKPLESMDWDHKANIPSLWPEQESATNEESLYSPFSLYRLTLAPAVPTGNVGIIQSDGNQDMRFFTLCSKHPCVIRMDACLECCVKCAQFVGAEYVLC